MGRPAGRRSCRRRRRTPAAATPVATTRPLLFDSATDLGGQAMNESIPTAVVEEMLGFYKDGAVIDLGAAVTGVWSDAATLTLTIASSADKSPDLADVGLAAAAGFATGIVVACKPAGAFPIRDAAAQFLPSVCNTTVAGDFGNRRPPQIQTAVASGADTDAVLGKGDTITVTWAAAVDRAGYSAGEALDAAKLAALFALRSADKTDLDLASLKPSGAWGSATQLTFTLGDDFGGETPPVRVIDGVTLELTGTGAKGGGSEGVRSADGTSLSGTAADNTVEITGSYGDLAGPALVSVVADDADDGDAILGAGDTLTLTFDVSTDRGLGVVGAGLPSLTKAQVDGLLIAPSLGTDYTGEWADDLKTMVITVVDPAGHNATMWADGAAGVVVSVRPTAKVYAASGLTLPASGPPTAITGDWGLLPAVGRHAGGGRRRERRDLWQ